MGIGTLRRYHARPDEGLVQDTGSPSPEGESPEVKAAREEFEAVSATLSELTTKIEAINADPDDSVGVTVELQQEYDVAFEAVEQAKIHLEEVELAATAGAAGDTSDAPTRSGSKADWVAYALAHGKTEAEIEKLTRDELAVLFLGPKE